MGFSVENNTPDRKADAVDESPPSEQETVLENKEIEDALEPRNHRSRRKNSVLQNVGVMRKSLLLLLK